MPLMYLQIFCIQQFSLFQGGYNCGRCEEGYIGGGTIGCQPAEGYCANGQRCDRNAECENHGYGEYSCECITGWAGNGVICGPDSDLDKWPDVQLPCNERNCKQVSTGRGSVPGNCKL